MGGIITHDWCVVVLFQSHLFVTLFQGQRRQRKRTKWENGHWAPSTCSFSPVVSCLNVSSASCGDKGLYLNQTLARKQTEELDPSKKSANPAGNFWHLFSPSPTDSLCCGFLGKQFIPPHSTEDSQMFWKSTNNIVGLAKAVHLFNANPNQIPSIRPH